MKFDLGAGSIQAGTKGTIKTYNAGKNTHKAATVSKPLIGPNSR
jgi:hypothetical protein